MDSECITAEATSKSAFPHPGKWLRKLYHWVLHWADTPYGTPALAALSFAESSFFPIPPDVLQIALSAGKPKRAFFYAAVNAIASVCGAVVGWWIGYAFWELLGGLFFEYVPGFTQEKFDKVGTWYQWNAFLAICGAAFTPIPFKVFTIAAGVFSAYVSLPTLVVASLIGRSARFFLVASVLYFVGPAATRFLERYFEWITFALFLLLVGGFLALRLFM